MALARLAVLRNEIIPFAELLCCTVTTLRLDPIVVAGVLRWDSMGVVVETLDEADAIREISSAIPIFLLADGPCEDDARVEFVMDKRLFSDPHQVGIYATRIARYIGWFAAANDLQIAIDCGEGLPRRPLTASVKQAILDGEQFARWYLDYLKQLTAFKEYFADQFTGDDK